MKRVLLLILPLAVIVSSCGYIGGKRVKGNGNVRTEDRTPGNFSGIASHGSFNVFVSTGPQSVRIEGDENLLQFIETYVEGSTLNIETRDGYWLKPKRDISIYITSPTFSSIQSYGSGDIIGRSPISDSTKMDVGVTGSANIDLEINAPIVDADITGSGDIKLRGETKSFKTEIHGSGNIRAMDLRSEETVVNIAGSGDAEVFASVRLKIEVAGSGDIRYRGNAQVSSNIAGSGGVRKVD